MPAPPNMKDYIMNDHPRQREPMQGTTKAGCLFYIVLLVIPIFIAGIL
jgi:hypothetical protein